MGQTAYAVAAIDPAGQVVGVSIFSEPNPTGRLALTLVVLEQITDVNYETAHKKLVAFLDNVAPWNTRLCRVASPTGSSRELWKFSNDPS